MTALVDTSVLIRLLTDDPPGSGARASAMLTGGRPASDGPLLVTDLVAAETLWVLESRYRMPGPVAVASLRAVIASPGFVCDDGTELVRILELHERGASVVDAHLVARAEREDLPIVTFDRDLGRGTDVVRIEP